MAMPISGLLLPFEVVNGVVTSKEIEVAYYPKPDKYSNGTCYSGKLVWKIDKSMWLRQILIYDDHFPSPPRIIQFGITSGICRLRITRENPIMSPSIGEDFLVLGHCKLALIQELSNHHLLRVKFGTADQFHQQTRGYACL